MKKLKLIPSFFLMVYTKLVKPIYHKLKRKPKSKILHQVLKAPLKSILTARELEICQLIVDGLTTKGIAEKLNLSKDTIHNHRSKIYTKTNCHNVADLVKYAIENEIVAIKK